MTYNDLISKIKAYLDYYDDELLAMVPFFVESAEKEVARILRIPSNEKFITLELTESVLGGVRDTLAIPTDFVEAKEMFIAETSEPVKLTILSALMRKRSGIDATVEGSGRYYARLGETFILYPELGEEESIFLNYYAEPVTHKDGQSTSYTLTIAPELLLYLSLKHAMVFLKNEEDAGKYNALAQNSLDQIRVQTERMESKPTMKVVPRRF